MREQPSECFLELVFSLLCQSAPPLRVIDESDLESALAEYIRLSTSSLKTGKKRSRELNLVAHPFLSLAHPGAMPT